MVDRAEPARLYDPTRYILEGRGKRFRPQLVLSSADLFGGNREVALKAAVAVEIFHIFTLVHDDIMDQSPTRRGRDTIHIRWDEPTAILTGDYLLGRTMEELLAFPDHRLRDAMMVFTDTVRQLCEGQIRDMAFEDRQDVTLAEYLQMIDQKTSALLECSLVLGGLSGKASTDDLRTLKEIGHHLGRAFQIQDDLLDLIASSDSWGKPVGGDLMAAKKTWLLLHALESQPGPDRTWFEMLVRNGGATEAEIPEARRRMEALGVLESARSAVLFHSDSAASRIASLPNGIGRDALDALTKKMQVRLH